VRNRATRASLWLFSAALFLAACQSIHSLTEGGLATLAGGPRRFLPIHFRGAHPSHAWQGRGRERRMITFPSQVQHVVVIVMENRTVDNLFAGYYSSTFCGPSHNAQCGLSNELDLHNPAVAPTLWPNTLERAV
jgi:phospholipase C